MRVRSRVFTAKRSEPQAAGGNARRGGSGVAKIPEFQIYPPVNAKRAPEGLFAAYANGVGADENVDIMPTEPQRYPNLAPRAIDVKTTYEGTDIKALSYKGEEVVFYIEKDSHRLRIETSGSGRFINDYNLPIFYRFDASVDAQRLAGALNAAIQLHPALTTVLEFEQSGDVVQRNRPEMFEEVRIEVIGWRWL